MLKFNFEAGRKKLFPAGYTQDQVDAINAIVSQINEHRVTLKTQAAYMLATAYHEAYNPHDAHSRMTQLVELGGESYLRSKKYYPWYGRGFHHLTWESNYENESRRMKIDLMAHPELMYNYEVAANSMVYDMLAGSVTGVKLSKYVNSGKTDFPNARRVINGTDQAEMIAGYATEFVKCLDVSTILPG